MNLIKLKLVFLSTLIFILLSFNAFGQVSKKQLDTKKNEVITLKYKSDLMKREMSYRVIFPQSYKTNKKERFAVLYLLHGLSGSYKNWTDSSKLAEYSTDYNYIIVMPDGNNGWYTDSAVAVNDKYESYIVKEIIPEIDRVFRTKKGRESRAIAGLSMGGYGALKFGLKYPEMFVLTGAFSGALRAAEWEGKDFRGWKAFANSIDKAFGTSKSETRKENNIFTMLESKSRDDLAKLPFVYIDCGTEDLLIKQNQDFSKLLFNQKVPHEFRQLPGRHNWKFWDAQIQEFLQLSRKHIK